MLIVVLVRTRKHYQMPGFPFSSIANIVAGVYYISGVKQTNSRLLPLGRRKLVSLFSELTQVMDDNALCLYCLDNEIKNKKNYFWENHCI